MNNRLLPLLSAFIGILCGFVTIHSPLGHSWTSIIFWVIAGLIIVAFCRDRRTAVYSGTLFGFFTIAAWLISGFQGTMQQLAGFSVMMLSFSILGGICGAAGAALFCLISKK